MTSPNHSALPIRRITTNSYTQQYSTNNYCMGYVYSRLGQTALKNLINQASTSSNQDEFLACRRRCFPT